MNKIDNEGLVQVETGTKFKPGDWVVWNEKAVCHIDSICQGRVSLMYTITDTNGFVRSYSVKGFEAASRFWTLNDAKNGDVLVINGILGLFDTFDIGVVKTHCSYDGIAFCPCHKAHFDGHLSSPAFNREREQLFEEMAKAGYCWSEKDNRLFRSEEPADAHKNGDDAICPDDLKGVTVTWDCVNGNLSFMNIPSHVADKIAKKLDVKVQPVKKALEKPKVEQTVFEITDYLSRRVEEIRREDWRIVQISSAIGHGSHLYLLCEREVRDAKQR